MSRSSNEILTNGNSIAKKGIQTLSGNIIYKSIEDQAHQILDSIFEIELNDFFEENKELNTHAERWRKDLLKKLAGYIVYRVKKKYPENLFLYANFTKDVQFYGEKSGCNRFLEAA